MQRTCTCHPDDRPPVCQRRYGAHECQDAWRAFVALGTETSRAIVLANRLLDEPYADPDDDLRVLSRQLLNTHQRLAMALSSGTAPTVTDGGPAEAGHLTPQPT